MSIKTEPDPLEEEAMNMFASVWVKVEVKENESKTCPDWNLEQVPPSNDINPLVPPKPKKYRRPTKQLKCDLCDYTTVYKNCLEIHVMGHYNLKPFSCNHCSYTTKYQSSLLRHATIKHNESEQALQNGQRLPMLQCDHCDYTSYFKWNLKAHKRKHKLDKQYKCLRCSYESSYKHNFLKHSRTHEKKEYEAFKCDKCPFETKFEGHIQRHLAKIHNEVSEKANNCDLCDFSTRERWRLNIHKQRSKQEVALKCSYCEFETYYMCESKRHKRTHYNALLKPNEASSMANEASSMALAKEFSKNLNEKILNLTNSMELESNEYQEQNQSNNETESIVNQGSHSQSNNYTLDPNRLDWNAIQVLESSDKDKPFQCHMCSYTSKFKASVQRHFQRHHTGTQSRPYKCVNCDFSTKTKDQIALHNKKSRSETPIQCTVCDFTTRFKCTSLMHQKIHYTFKCSDCPYSCRQKYDLTKHYLAFHLGSGLKCQYCDFTSARKESVLCHETIHTGNKPFKCNFCDYSSVRKSLLDSHLKRMHSGINKDKPAITGRKIESLKVPIPDNNKDEKNCCNVSDIQTGSAVQRLKVLDFTRDEDINTKIPERSEADTQGLQNITITPPWGIGEHGFVE